MNVSAQSRPSIRFRGRNILALTLAPRPPFAEWISELAEWNKRSPGFFKKRPVILDVSRLKLSKQSLAALLADLARRGVRPIAIEGADDSLLGAGMPPPIGNGRDIDLPAATATDTQPPSIVLDEPVRSGRSVVFPSGDVTVVGSVASGAEIVAGGSIHVYGTLHGRAIAGASGGAGARIFCGKLDAELLSINGLYKTADEMRPELHGLRIHAWREGGALKITALA